MKITIKLEELQRIRLVNASDLNTKDSTHEILALLGNFEETLCSSMKTAMSIGGVLRMVP